MWKNPLRQSCASSQEKKIATLQIYGKFGDVVAAIEYPIPLITSSKGDLFEGNVTLSCYPQEFIFAEKLETVVHRRSFNSRMKDFHDLYSMMSLAPFLSNIERIIRLVFENRETRLILPIMYEKDEMHRLQNFWNEYLRNLRAEHRVTLPKDMSDVVAKINDWLRLNTGLINS